jgi:hypothetical protein
MNYEAFIQALHFRDLQPDQPVPPHLPVDFQMHNLILPDPSLLKQLSQLLSLKGMSSLAILALIQQGVEQMPPRQHVPQYWGLAGPVTLRRSAWQWRSTRCRCG